jgi:hypothetical protein
MRYLKKLTVAHRFKRDVLSQDAELDELEKLELWLLYLNMLATTKEISRNQAKTWTYPTKELK